MASKTPAETASCAVRARVPGPAPTRCSSPPLRREDKECGAVGGELSAPAFKETGEPSVGAIEAPTPTCGPDDRRLVGSFVSGAQEGACRGATVRALTYAITSMAVPRTAKVSTGSRVAAAAPASRRVGAPPPLRRPQWVLGSRARPRDRKPWRTAARAFEHGLPR
jgi:hypothetical protein